MTCYDFPEVVIHDPDGCGRYEKGGVCFPFPTPKEPYSEEERKAVENYDMIMKAMVGDIPDGMTFQEHTALGTTVPPPQDEFHD